MEPRENEEHSMAFFSINCSITEIHLVIFVYFGKLWILIQIVSFHFFPSHGAFFGNFMMDFH